MPTPQSVGPSVPNGGKPLTLTEKNYWEVTLREPTTDIAGGRIFHDHRREVLTIRRKGKVAALDDEYARKRAALLSDNPVPLDTEADRLDFGYFSYTPPPEPPGLLERLWRLLSPGEPHAG